MRFLVAVTALAAASSFGTAAFAQSQQHRGPYGSPALSDRTHVLPVSDMARPVASAALPPHEVITILRSMGFDPASRPVLRGPVWVVRAFDDQDLLVRVAVDARTGRVVNVAEARRVAGFGPRRFEPEEDAYPVPPASVPGGRVVEETEEIASVSPQARAYPEEAYDERIYRTPGPRSVVPPANGYRPVPYVPAPHTSARPAPHPKVATRTPAPAKPAAPKVKSQAVSPAPQAAAPPPQEKPPAVAQRAPDHAANESAHGVSIPAPVAHKAAPPEPTDTAPASPPADKKVDGKADDLKLVPVAPLE